MTEQPLTEEERIEPAPRPSLVINIHSWATPIVGVVTLIVGLLGGYFGRPLLRPGTLPAQSVAAFVTPASDVPAAPPATANPTEVATRLEAMDFLVQQTKHFKGEASAPVTMLEFSDFQ